jgi:type IV secretion system protein VirB9
MNRAIIFGLLAGTILASPALAEQDPRPGARDARVRYVAYDAINVVKVTATDLRSTLIQFGDDETVDVVAIGDQTAWSWSKVRNLLFIKPSVSPARPSNMQVVTLRKDGSQRVYEFDLAGQAGDTASPVFGINFTYPTDVAEARKKAAAEKATQDDADRARQRLSADYYYGVRNWQYVARGSVSIQPTEVSDNGETTAFRFPGNTPQPAIYEITPDGKEQIASVTSAQDLAVAHGTAHGWRLRLGNEVCDVWNVGYDPVGQNPGTGTTSPEVVRTVVKEHSIERQQ